MKTIDQVVQELERIARVGRKPAREWAESMIRFINTPEYTNTELANMLASLHPYDEEWTEEDAHTLNIIARRLIETPDPIKEEP